MYAEEDYIMVSALQHYCYCQRQFALIHMDQYWRENYLTADGRCLHARVDLSGNHRGGGRRVEYALPISSAVYGLAGKCDAVEFLRGGEVVIPVEYKRGKPKEDSPDEVQLCAQTLCLEEMLKMRIEKAALFYFEHREKIVIEINNALRQRCANIAGEAHALLLSGQIPAPVYERRKCQACSLFDYCMPRRREKAEAIYGDALA